MREKQFDQALKRIAEVLTLDKIGEYREPLVRKMEHVLPHVSARNQQEYLLLINLVNRHAKPKGGTALGAFVLLRGPSRRPSRAWFAARSRG
jgi:hypothetical protein